MSAAWLPSGVDERNGEPPSFVTMKTGTRLSFFFSTPSSAFAFIRFPSIGIAAATASLFEPPPSGPTTGPASTAASAAAAAVEGLSNFLHRAGPAAIVGAPARPTGATEGAGAGQRPPTTRPEARDRAQARRSSRARMGGGASMSTSSTRLSSARRRSRGPLGCLSARVGTMGMAAPPLRADRRRAAARRSAWWIVLACRAPPVSSAPDASSAPPPRRKERVFAATAAPPLKLGRSRRWNPVALEGSVTNRSVTALILRTIGYVPGQLLPLEFGGPLEDFELDARHNYSRREAATRGPRLQPMRGQRAAEASGAGPAASWLASPVAQLLPQSRARPRTPRKRSQMMRKQAAEQPGPAAAAAAARRARRERAAPPPRRGAGEHYARRGARGARGARRAGREDLARALAAQVVRLAQQAAREVWPRVHHPRRRPREPVRVRRRDQAMRRHQAGEEARRRGSRAEA